MVRLLPLAASHIPSLSRISGSRQSRAREPRPLDADLTSATSYWRRTEKQTMDTTEAIESLFDLFFGVKQFVPNGYTE